MHTAQHDDRSANRRDEAQIRSGLRIEVFSHWHDPSDGMVMPTRCACRAAE